MNRAAFEHLLRAAGSCTGEFEFYVFGSQAILGALPTPDPRLLFSAELDLCPASDSQDARDAIDGTIGELSPFHETHGVYAQGVSMRTAYLPADWLEHAVVVHNENTGGVQGICPQPVDVVSSKLARGDIKDCAYARVAVESGSIDGRALIERAGLLVAPEVVRLRAQELAIGIVSTGADIS